MARVCTLKSTRDGGVGTVVRNTLAVLSGLALFLGVATTANAFEVKKTSKGELVHWEESTVKYTIDPSVDQNVAQATDATLEAMKSWSGTVGAPDLGTLAHDDASPTKPGFDQKNGVFYMAGGYAPAGKALAITVLTYDNATGRILDADVIFNGSYAFQVLAPPGAPVIVQESPTAAHPSTTDNITHDDEGVTAEGTVYDLHHVVAHELGHSLGMNDELVRKDALMYRYSAPNDATMRAPATDDIEGLAELYSTQIEAHGNGCGNATVSPKAPSHTASHAAMFAMFGLLMFLVLRAKSDRRARLGFVLAAAATTILFVPSLSGKSGSGIAQASQLNTNLMVGHASAKILSTSTAMENGLFKTTYKLATTDCRAQICPDAGHGVAWGGTVGNITQEVGGYYAPASGDVVNVSFEKLPSNFNTLKSPLTGRIDTTQSVAVRVLTPATRR